MRVALQDNGLTPKQERFINELMIDGNATKAAIRAGYAPDSATTIAHQALLKPHVAAELARRQEKMAEQADVTAVWITTRLMTVVERCLQSEPALDKNGEETGEFRFDAQGANKALELLGKRIGYFKPVEVNLHAEITSAREALYGRMADIKSKRDAQLSAGVDRGRGDSAPVGLELLEETESGDTTG